jgi:hypothetical protein
VGAIRGIVAHRAGTEAVPGGFRAVAEVDL